MESCEWLQVNFSFEKSIVINENVIQAEIKGFFTFQLAFFGVVTSTPARPRDHWNSEYDDVDYKRYPKRGKE